MLKKPWTYCSISVLILLIGSCAPKVAPPVLYEKQDLTLNEVIQRVGGDVDTLKAIADIEIKRHDEHYSSVMASALVKRPDWIHLRMYQLGILVKDVIMKDNRLYVLTGKEDRNLRKFGAELYNAIFWWDDIHDGVMRREGDEYVISTMNRVIRLDSGALLPIEQTVAAGSKRILIRYEDPRNTDGFWYASKMVINVDDYVFTVRLSKLVRNPLLGDADFRIPAEL